MDKTDSHVAYYFPNWTNHPEMKEEFSINGYDSMITNLSDIRRAQFKPFSNIFHSFEDRGNHNVYLPKMNYSFKKNVQFFEKALEYSFFVGIQYFIVECPDDVASIEILAHSFQRKLTEIESKIDKNLISLVIKVPLISNIVLSSHSKKDSVCPEIDTWNQWNKIRMVLGSNKNLFVALDLSADLPGKEICQRWFGEPVKMIFLSTSLFLNNSSGLPVLSNEHKNFICEIEDKLFRNISYIIKGSCFHAQPRWYSLHIKQLVSSFWKSELKCKLPSGCKFEVDILKAPLQPLKDDLLSSVYETFETDFMKYFQYESAIIRALKKVQKNQITVMVVGAGRGPLVDKTLNAARDLGKFVTVWAVEKNRHAVSVLESFKVLCWGGEKGLDCGRVQIVNKDMRTWAGPDGKADLIVSELLGSFSDNELSPECLDGVWRYSSKETICIPRRYTSYLQPVQSHKLHSSIWSPGLYCPTSSILSNSTEYAYVVNVRNAYLIDNVKPVFTFKHDDLTLPPHERDNERSISLTFRTELDTVCHGFIGYFDCELFEDVELSIVPSTKTLDMDSWFPIYFPIEEPLQLSSGSTIKVHMTRKVNDTQVWYEWSILEPITTKVHNKDGSSWSIGLI